MAKYSERRYKVTHDLSVQLGWCQNVWPRMTFMRDLRCFVHCAGTSLHLTAYLLWTLRIQAHSQPAKVGCDSCDIIAINC